MVNTLLVNSIIKLVFGIIGTMIPVTVFMVYGRHMKKQMQLDKDNILLKHADLSLERNKLYAAQREMVAKECYSSLSDDERRQLAKEFLTAAGFNFTASSMTKDAVKEPRGNALSEEELALELMDQMSERTNSVEN